MHEPGDVADVQAFQDQDGLVEASNIAVSLDAMLPENKALFHREVTSALGVRANDIAELTLIKRSVDARKKSNVHFVVTCAVKLREGVRVKPARGVNVKPHVPAAPLRIPDCSGAFAAAGEPRPVVVGAGPAGLFCALYLARAGLRPLLIERGAPVDERVRVIEAFDRGAPLDVVTNIQFGEGGAGTFSDGKLNTGTKSPHIRHVLEEFARAGAPSDILVDAKPHIGTDKLVDVVRNLRRSVEEAGGEARFFTQLVGLQLDAAGRVAGVRLRDVRTGEEHVTAARRVVLACGHSARDTFAMLNDAGALMCRKPFAVGVRIEHPQGLIDQAQYGAAAKHKALGAADYKLAVHTKAGRGVYTFCMCPGGEVVAAASEEGGVCVNGMSRHARDGQNANSALLVSVEPEDFPGEDVLAGVAFQREIERAAYDVALTATGVPYAAPAQTVGDFLSQVYDARCGTSSSAQGQDGFYSFRQAHERHVSFDQDRGRLLSPSQMAESPSSEIPVRQARRSSLVKPTYPRGVAWADLRECLPEFVTDAMAEALPLLDAKLHGFAHPEAVMTAVEARSSSPVRIVRDEVFQAMFSQGEDRAKDAVEGIAEPDAEASAKSAAKGASETGISTLASVAVRPVSRSGLYPCGEGAGYAGGITSAAVDGLRVAEAIAHEFDEALIFEEREDVDCAPASTP